MNKVPRRNAVGAAALAILVYSGQLGASPVLSWLPINVTFLSASIVVLTFIASIVEQRQLSPWILLPAGLWVLFIIPAVRYVPGSYPSDKFATLMTVSLLCVIAPFQLLRLHIQRIFFLGTLVVVAVLSSVVIIQNGETAAAKAGLSSDIILLEGANTISTARIVGTGALILISVALAFSGGRKRRRGLFLILGIVLVVVMVATGSRGPLAGIISGIAALILISPALHGRRIKSLILLALSSLAIYIWSALQGFVSSDRAFAWLAGERDTSTQAREYLWETAGRYILMNPQGTGWGGFTTLDGVSWHHPYPHNLVLELYVETGWFVGTLAVGFILCSLVKLMLQAKDPITCALFALAVFSLVNAIVSGDINDNRLMWILLAAAWVLPRTPSTQRIRPSVKKSAIPATNPIPPAPQALR